MDPTVTFVVPCYNYGRFVTQAINSLLDQTLRDIEIIVVDDASSDNTREVLSAYAGHSRVRVITHAINQGHIRSYNEGLALARGKYIGLLSADDFCLGQDGVERQVAEFEKHPSVVLVYSAHALVEDEHQVTISSPAPADYVRSGWDEFRTLIWTNYLPASGTLMRKEVLARIGMYSELLPHAGDWDLWLRATTQGDFAYLAEPLYAYRMHRGNMSHRQISPAEATNEVLLTVERAFAALPADAPPEIFDLRRRVLRHGWFRSAWIDMYHGRRLRTWQGLAYALRSRPALTFSGEFWRFLPRIALMTLFGREWFRTASAALLRRRRSVPTLA